MLFAVVCLLLLRWFVVCWLVLSVVVGVKCCWVLLLGCGCCNCRCVLLVAAVCDCCCCLMLMLSVLSLVVAVCRCCCVLPLLLLFLFAGCCYLLLLVELIGFVRVRSSLFDFVGCRLCWLLFGVADV